MASATFPIKAVLYEIITLFAEEAIASCSTARPTRMAKRAEAVAAANPATHTATKKEGNLSRSILALIKNSYGDKAYFFKRLLMFFFLYFLLCAFNIRTDILSKL